MYDSLKKWIDVPITVMPFERRSATGDKIFGDSYEILCYPQGEVNIVRNWQGVEIVSHNHLYVNGDINVGKLDEIVFEGEQHPVQAISSYYRNGKPDIKVVYI